MGLPMHSTGLQWMQDLRGLSATIEFETLDLMQVILACIPAKRFIVFVRIVADGWIMHVSRWLNDEWWNHDWLTDSGCGGVGGGEDVNDDGCIGCVDDHARCCGGGGGAAAAAAGAAADDGDGGDHHAAAEGGDGDDVEVHIGLNT